MVTLFLCALALTWIVTQFATCGPRRTRISVARAKQLKDGWSRGQLSVVTKSSGRAYQPVRMSSRR